MPGKPPRGLAAFAPPQMPFPVHPGSGIPRPGRKRKRKPRLTIDTATLFEISEAMTNERRLWRVMASQTVCWAVRTNMDTVSKYDFGDNDAAYNYIRLKVIAAGLAVLGISVSET